MANQLYPAGKRAMMRAEIDLENDTINCSLIVSGYTYDPSHDDYVTHIQGNELTSIALANKVVIGEADDVAIFDADDPTFSSVVASNTVVAVVLYHPSSGTPLLYVDTATGIPFVTNGGDVTLNFSNLTERFFKL